MDGSAGFVHLVGAGPGDPGLLTLRGRDVLAQCDVVLFDHLVQRRLLETAPPAAERVYVGKRAGHAAMSQEAINARLIEEARRGRRVVRLKGGDPWIFGRGGEEAEALYAAGIPFAVVPGVTSGVGVTAYAGLAVTHRAIASAVAFVTGHEDPTVEGSRPDWQALASFPGTLVVYMGARRLRAITTALIAAGKPGTTPAAVVERGTTPTQRTIVGTLADLADRAAAVAVGPPALTVIGPIVDRRDALAWFERRPLFGRRIMVTRPLDESLRVAPGLEDLGAEVLVAPLVEIASVADPSAMDDALDRMGQFDWLVFTSSHGVEALLRRLLHRGGDLRGLGGVRLAAIGPTTAAALATFHLRADLIPDSYRSEGLAEALRPLVAGRRILLARADRGRSILPEQLSQVATIEQVAVYRNVDCGALDDEIAARLASGTVDWVTLTSPAIAERFLSLVPPAARGRLGSAIKLASLSPVTSEVLSRHKVPIAVEARPHTWDSLVEGILRAESFSASSPSTP